ncbi:hypothetical protein SAMN05661093_06576 [Kibdelosporangium aridum]|uniref:Uncharacterized protein n=2 Tax=Kibdelosporangium aridum TaxID=2030 RepID=A0A1W2FGP8_KIBAR|nr:hypothetical protein SAMN05661093_06576 [Kibdelosporangium aridum]
MPKPMDRFTVSLPKLEDVANHELPAVANALRAPANILRAHEGLEGPGRFQPVYAMEGAYARFTDSVAFRQIAGCDRIEKVAQSLSYIANLYRRADGQR